MFAEAADPAGGSKAVWRSFAPGSASAASGAVKRLRQVTRHAVAYLAFASLDDAVAFSDTFIGTKFQDPDALPGSQPQEFIARVERAPWQAVSPLNKRVRPSPIQGTIESDPDYLAFVERLEDEAKREVSRAGALTVAQTSAMFPVKNAGAASASQSGSDKGDTAAGGVLTTRGKVGAVALKGSELITPLMEDVRARRMERDQKKKAIKSVSRPPRSKGRQIVVIDPAIRQQGEPPRKGSSSSSRRKKQRDRARAAENATKKQEEAQAHKRVNGSVPINGRRGGGGVARRGVIEPRMNGNVHPNAKGSTYQNGAAASDANGFGGNGKGNGPRGGSGRPRAGRGGRPKAQYNPGPASAASGSIDGSHASVRLLKKETSNGHKT